MLIDLKDVDNIEPLCADVTIIGAGAVGLVMAKSLTERGVRVVVVEAGGPIVTPESQLFFTNARSIGANLEGLHVGRFRALGGTTNFWGGQLVEFDANTFVSRKPAGEHSAWPIDGNDLAPYYRKVLELSGHETMVRDDGSVFKQVGIEVPDWGADIEMFVTRWMHEPNLARLFRSEITRHANLQVLTGAQAVGFEMSSGGRVVTAVRVKGASGVTKLLPVKQLVLANGTIEIARMMAAAAVEDRSLPWAQNPWLGKGFMDHVDCVVGDVVVLDKLRFHLLFDNFFLKGHKYTPKLKLSAAAQERLGCLQVAGIFGFRSSLADHLDNIKIFAKSLLRGRYVSDVNLSLSDLIATFRVSLPMIFRYIRYNRMYNPTDLGVYLRVSAEQKMVRESGLYLRDEKDAFGIPMIDVDWKIDGSEVESIALFAEAVGAQLQATGLARLEIDPALEQRSAEFLSKIDDANHHMGMARMSETSETGVVDMNLRVQGCDNLFVAGAAVFPSTGFANPTFTAMALGVRLCDYLVENEIAQ